MDLFGLELTVVSSGLQAVEAWRGGKFDFHGRKRGDARYPRHRAGARPSSDAILALSANAFQHQIADYLAAGMDGHVAKPIELTVLQRALRHVLLSDCDDPPQDRSTAA